jgi:hypothetical protein
MGNSIHSFETVWATLDRVGDRLNMVSDKLNMVSDILDRVSDRLDRVGEKLDRVAESQAETGLQIAKLEKLIGGVSNNNGLFAEEYFYNSLDHGDKILMGEKFDKLIKSKILVDYDHKTKGELDIILINGKSVAIIEVKFRVRDKHIEKVMKKVKPFREQFPEYQNHKVYLGLASIVFDEDIEDKCKENGIAVIKQVGDNVVVNDNNLRVFGPHKKSRFIWMINTFLKTHTRQMRKVSQK